MITIFEATCGSPVPLSPDESKARPYEEGAACLWLWAWPSFLGWPADIAWLFSPQVEKRRWPGDLWGVDSRGELLILEAKTCTPLHPTCDPFEDFLLDGPGVVNGGCDTIHAGCLRQRWEKYFTGERTFYTEHLDDLRDGKPLEGCYPGVVTYGYHRAQVQRWRQVYIDLIARELARHDWRDYRCRVDEYLRVRKQKGNPQPHIIGLGALVDVECLRLSRKGWQHYRELARRLGPDRVHLISIKGRKVSSTCVHIESRRGPCLADEAHEKGDVLD